MPTTFYMTNPGSTGDPSFAPASLTRGAVVRQSLGATFDDGFGCFWGPTAGPTWKFQTNALNAFTLSGTVTVNVWMKEGNMSANMGAQVLLQKVASGGAVTTIGTLSKGVELGTTFAAQNFSGSVGTHSIASGDKIRFTFSQSAIGAAGCPYTGCDMTAGSGSASVSGDTYVTFTETVTEQTGTTYTQTLNASLTFSGSVSKEDRKTLAGGVSFSGSVAKESRRTLAGGLSFAGSLAKRTARTLAGGLSFSGALSAAKIVLLTFNAGLTFSGGLAKEARRTLAGGLSFSGSLAKRTARSLAASLTPAGALVKRTARTLEGGLTFSGSLARAKVALVTFNAGLTFSGSLAKQTARGFVASLPFSGALAKRTGKALSGGMAFSGALSRRTGKALSGSVGFGGALAKETRRILAGGLSFVGSLASELITAGGNAYTITFNAGLTFAGGLSRRTSRAFTATLAPAGTLSKRTARSLAAGLSFAGSLTPYLATVYTIVFNATVGFSGQLLGGSLRIAGSALERTRIFGTRYPWRRGLRRVRD